MADDGVNGDDEVRKLALRYGLGTVGATRFDP